LAGRKAAEVVVARPTLHTIFLYLAIRIRDFPLLAVSLLWRKPAPTACGGGDDADLDEALHELVDLVVDRATVAGGG